MFFEFILVDSGRKKVIFGAIPTINLPQRSHDSSGTQVIKRKERPIYKEPHIQCKKIKSNNFFYKSFKELCLRIPQLKTLRDNNWSIEIKTDRIILSFSDSSFVSPRYTIQVDDSLGYTISVYGWLLPETHEIYKNYHRSIRNVNILNITQELSNFNICQGADHQLKSFMIHSVQLCNDPLFDDMTNPFPCKVWYRSNDCKVICTPVICIVCSKVIDAKEKSNLKKVQKPLLPASLKAPISLTSPDRVKLTLQNQRLKCKQLEEKIETMKTSLKEQSVPVDRNMSDDLISIFSNTDAKNVTPFMNLFWQEQKKLFSSTNSKGYRFHPMIIRFCLSLVAKSPSCYEELRNTGVLVLPSQRTLRDYRNYIKPHAGFNYQVIEELIDITNEFFDTQRYVVILMDEMKIRSNLVYDRTSGQLVGFTDLGDPKLNFNNLTEDNDLASHMLVFLLRGLCTNLKYSLAYFATHKLQSYQIMSLFWDAVFILEKKCNLWVLAVTSDGASINRGFYRMHKNLDGDSDTMFCYRTINMWAKYRYIYFISDVPHLLKTLRNALYHSALNGSRFLWNNGHHLLWQHITKIYYFDTTDELRCLPKLTMEHIKLNSYSTMKVYLAAQVLSSTMSVVLEQFGGNECIETAKFCKIVDSFFDCFNVRSKTEGVIKRKPNLLPFECQDDGRFSWLLNDFLGYFDTWKNSIESREGDFSKNEQSNMFIPWQTYEGIHITTRSIVEATRFLLEEGVEFVLTERFCQDPLEQYFGNQRRFGCRNVNPDLFEAGYFDNTIRIQKSISCSSGNTKGRFDKSKNWVNVVETKLPKRKHSEKYEGCDSDQEK